MKDGLTALTEKELLLRLFENADRGRNDLDGSDYMRFAWGKAQEYGEQMNASPLHVLRKFESRRDYWAVNYYQEAGFPSLEKVHVFETQADLAGMVPQGFRCPACSGVSKSPYECDSGVKNDDGAECDWKSFGLFGTLGKGLSFTVKETFLDHCRVENCFYPVAMERTAA